MIVRLQCGQKLYRLRDWTARPVYRKLRHGFAVGPVMIWFRKTLKVKK